MSERINYEQETDLRVTGEHIVRYWLAYRYMDHGDVVVDAACGNGFGTELLAGKASSVFAFDKDEQALRYAQNKFFNSRTPIFFTQADLNNVGLPPGDVLVTYETIEHLENPENLISQFDKYDKVFLSTPRIPTKHFNEFHLQDFTDDQILSWFPADTWKIRYARRQTDDVYLVVYAQKLSSYALEQAQENSSPDAGV